MGADTYQQVTKRYSYKTYVQTVCYTTVCYITNGTALQNGTGLQNGTWHKMIHYYMVQLQNGTCNSELHQTMDWLGVQSNLA